VIRAALVDEFRLMRELLEDQVVERTKLTLYVGLQSLHVLLSCLKLCQLHLSMLIVDSGDLSAESLSQVVCVFIPRRRCESLRQVISELDQVQVALLHQLLLAI